jgi:NAD(P)-dependent dehydrogenase (short-subunit alcohol dehydrogenase family)
MEKPFQNKLVLVTGASRGIGWHAAMAFAHAGAHVIAVARTSGALEELDDQITQAGGSATLVPLDLTDYEGIDRLGGAIFERWGKLDVLVANAGILGTLSPLDHFEPKTWSRVMDVNVTANWRLIRSVTPLLKKADHGRAIFVSSAAARQCTPFWGAYSVSKAALEALVATYAAETQSTNVRVSMVDPGPMRTAMRAQAMPGEDPESLPSPDELAPHFLTLASDDFDRTGAMFSFKSGQLSGGMGQN